MKNPLRELAGFRNNYVLAVQRHGESNGPGGAKASRTCVHAVHWLRKNRVQIAQSLENAFMLCIGHALSQVDFVMATEIQRCQDYCGPCALPTPCYAVQNVYVCGWETCTHDKTCWHALNPLENGAAGASRYVLARIEAPGAPRFRP